MADINIRSGRLMHMQSKPGRKPYLNKQEEGTYRPFGVSSKSRMW